MDDALQIYFAAALFDDREKLYNKYVTELLESKGYIVKLPQDDGFEFSNLKKALSDLFEPEYVDRALQKIIYILDMGVFVAESDIILANLDEQVDEGVVVEMTYGHDIGKYIIGYTTDVRAPFGDLSDVSGGTHFFPIFQCDVFINHNLYNNLGGDIYSKISNLVDQIDSEIKQRGIIKQKYHPNYILNNPNLSNNIKGAEILFKGIDDIHSEEGLKEIAKRYVDNKERLELLR